MKRYRVRGPHEGGAYGRWTVVDTADKDIAVDVQRRKSDAIDTAKELNERNDATEKLHETPCPGCGFEPEVVNYYRRKSDKVRVGYDCTCGAHVVNGVVLHMGGSR